MVGVRPEKVQISLHPAASCLKSVVQLVGFVGDYKLVTFRVGGKSEKALTPISFSVAENLNIWFSADRERIHVVEKKSGKTLMKSERQT